MDCLSCCAGTACLTRVALHGQLRRQLLVVLELEAFLVGVPWLLAVYTDDFLLGPTALELEAASSLIIAGCHVGEPALVPEAALAYAPLPAHRGRFSVTDRCVVDRIFRMSCMLCHAPRKGFVGFRLPIEEGRCSVVVHVLRLGNANELLPARSQTVVELVEHLFLVIARRNFVDTQLVKEALELQPVLHKVVAVAQLEL